MKYKTVIKTLIVGCALILSLAGCTKKGTGDINTFDSNVEATELIEESSTDKISSIISDEESNKEDIEQKVPEDDSGTSAEEETDEEESDENTNKDETNDSKEENEEIDSSANESSANQSNTGQSNTNQNNAGGSNSGSNGSSTGSANTTSPHTHSYDGGVVTKYANCSAVGVKTYTCQCGVTYTENIPMTAHTFVNGTCSVCGAADPNSVTTYTYEVFLDTGMIDLVNARRNALGYGSISWDSSLDEIAKTRARQIADDFGHDYNQCEASEFITMTTSYYTTSQLHNNYVNSAGHDMGIHKNDKTRFSSATCIKRNNKGEVCGTYNIILVAYEQAPGAVVTPGNGQIDPNPPAPEDIIW